MNNTNTLFGNIENMTLDNTRFRTIIYTTLQQQLQQQLVVMSVKDSIPRERHRGITQFIRVESGHGTAIVERGTDVIEYELLPGDYIAIPPMTYHTIINRHVGKEDLKLYTIYSPPAH